MVHYNPTVISDLNDYFAALLRYPISYSRAIEKLSHMLSCLNRLDTYECNSICRYIDLGQTFHNGKPVNTCLYQYNYQDPKSKTKWSFSYTQDNSGNAYVLKMKFSSFIKRESSLHHRKHVIKESDLRRIIRESIYCVLRG